MTSHKEEAFRSFLKNLSDDIVGVSELTIYTAKLKNGRSVSVPVEMVAELKRYCGKKHIDWRKL